MFNGLWEYLTSQLQNNQLFSGGLILMIGGAIVAYGRQIPQHLYQMIRRKLITEIDILDRDPAFEWVEKWLAEHAYARKRARSLTVKTVAVDYQARRENPLLDPRPRILFSPAPGVHWLFYQRRLLCLHRERPKPSDGSVQPANVRESFNITLFSRDRRLAQQLLEDARELAIPKSQARLTVHRANSSYWTEQMTRMPRPIDSVVLPEGVMEDILEDVRTFLGRRDWYLQRGIPYRRGYLFYGPPGTGKSSTVLGVASALGMDIAMLSLGDSSLDDNGISELLSDVPANSLVVMEDIDCAFIDRKEGEDKRSKITFSGLLNAIDGVAAGEGRILMATTNHLHHLDLALIRPGRIDRKLFIGFARREQAKRLFLRFFPQVGDDLASFFAESIPEESIPMSSLQMHLLRYAHDPLKAVSSLDEVANLSAEASQHKVASFAAK